jgi:hypothetical protein
MIQTVASTVASEDAHMRLRHRDSARIATPRVVLAGMLGAVLMCLTPVAIAQPLITELVGVERVRASVSAREAAEFARITGAGDVEKQAADELVTSARLEISRAINRHLRRVRDGDTLVRESQIQLQREAAAVERELLSELSLLAGPDRAEGFERFQFARRRAALLREANGCPVPIDLTSSLERMGIAINATPELKDAVLRNERDLDAALVARQQALMNYYTAVRAGYDQQGGPLSNARDETLRAWQISDAKLARAQVTGWRLVASALPPEALQKLALERVAAIFASIDTAIEMSVYGPDIGGTPIYREVMALGSLTPEQRDQAAAALAEYEAEYQSRVKRFLEAYDDDYFKPAAERKGSSNILNPFSGERDELRKKLNARVLGLLSPQQRTEYDESPVLFREGASPIDPE